MRDFIEEVVDLCAPILGLVALLMCIKLLVWALS